MGDRKGADEIAMVGKNPRTERIYMSVYLPWERSLIFGKGALCVGIVQTPGRLLL
jgi:hypothetical protein